MPSRAKTRLIFELVIAGLVFLATFFEQDELFFMMLRYWFLVPLLGILLVVRVLEILIIRPTTRSKIFMTTFVLLFFLSGTVFGNEVAYLREIIRFHAQKHLLDQIALTAPTLSKCAIASKSACYQDVSIATRSDGEATSATVFSVDQRLGVAVHSRNDISLVHLTTDQVSTQDVGYRLQISIYTIFCTYKLSDDGWYLCSSNLFGRGECFLGTCGYSF